MFEVSEPDFEDSRIVSRLWIANTSECKPRQITFSYEGEHSARWSPDGNWLAFLSERPDQTDISDTDDEEERLDQIWLMPLDGGEAFALTDVKEGIEHYEWSPDSQSIVFLTREKRTEPFENIYSSEQKRKVDPIVEHGDKRRKQLWEVVVDDKKCTLIFSGDFGIEEFALSPNGQRIAYITNYSGEANDYHLTDIFVLDLNGDSEPTKVVQRKGSKRDAKWSADGSQISFVGGRNIEHSFSQECLFVAPSIGGEIINLSDSIDFDIDDYYWQSDGTIICSAIERTNTPLYRFSSGTWGQITTDSSIVVSSFHADKAGNVVAVIENGAEFPELLWLTASGERNPITEFSNDFREKVEVPRQDVVSWESDFGTIEGVLTWPNDADLTDKFPLVVQVHGGPKGRSSNTLRSYHMHAVWAARGYMVFRPNFRGSEGYGNAFATSNFRDLGGGDYRDIMAGIDHLIDQGYIDPTQLAIMGGSYGGYMTNWAISQTDRFKAAISLFGIFHLTTDFSNSDIPRFEHEYLGAYYWEDLEAYTKLSPGTYADKIKTPTLIIHGQSDNNTYISNSRELYRALKTRGDVPVEFVHYPREGHGILEPNHRLDEMRRTLSWIDRWMKPDEGFRKYQLGDKFTFGEFEVCLNSASEAEFLNRPSGDPRLVEISIAVSSVNVIELPWIISLSDVILQDRFGTECRLSGVRVDGGGSSILVEGDNFHFTAWPDKDTGRLSTVINAVYEVGSEGGEYVVMPMDLPAIVFHLDPKDPEEENNEE